MSEIIEAIIELVFGKDDPLDRALHIILLSVIVLALFIFVLFYFFPR